MDQDSFRKLLSAPGAAAGATRRAAPSAASSRKPAKTKKADTAQPAFKPRTVKKDDYRDRASERRHGLDHDYAQVEALAEDFERRNADKDRETLEQQRKYLGGDSEHTVLVKGLDFALLEQNKARLAASTAVEDDDTLEQAFIEGSSTVPKKRTRDDILRELKSKRLKGEPVPDLPAETTDAALEEAKKAGKFKPIGFKPIGSSGKKKKAKEGDKDGAKKKKKKTAGTEEAQAQPTTAAAEENAAPSQQSTTKPPPPPPEPLDDDDDIFAGAGEYTGLDLGDDDDDEDAADKHAEKDMSDGELPEPAPRRWVDIDDPTPVLPRKSSSPSRAAASPSAAPPPRSASPDREREAEADAEEGEAEEEDAPVRLQPLASSAVPSIRELLAMDEEVEKAEKRRARKEKKKGALTAEGKVERDYQRLKAYTEKKGNAK